MDYSQNFITAFNVTMRYEVGPWYDANDNDTIYGNISTTLQKRKCGYVDSDGDSGGCTKYGIAQADNPNVNVKALTLVGAMSIYFADYWQRGACDAITIPITVFHFDTCVNNGVSRANKILQQACNVYIDGEIGPITLAAINHRKDCVTLINTLSKIRIDLYNTIVKNNPDQREFLDGWLRRVSEVTQFSLAQLTTG